MEKFPRRVSETVKDLYIKKYLDKGVEELCRSLEKEKGKYDRAIMVLGSGFVKFRGKETEKEYLKAEFMEHVREAAGAVIFREMEKEGNHPVIIVSGGKVYGKENEIPTLAEISKKEMVARYGIDPEKIIVQPFSIDTSQEARHNSAILETLGFLENDKDSEEKKSLVITSEFHAKRADLLFKRHFEGNVSAMGAEGILLDFVKKLPSGKEQHPYKKVIENYLASDSYEKYRAQDKKTLAVAKLPLGEKLIEFLAYYLRVAGGKKEIPEMPKKNNNQKNGNPDQKTQ